VRRLLTGELRQGVLAGLMVDAVPRRPGSRERSCAGRMPSGDLTRTAEVALAEGEEGLRGIGFELFRPIANCG
jgi:ATP-dependent DNA ligase